jgi:hypothetical protein
MDRFRPASIAVFVGSNAVGSLGLLGTRIFEDSHIVPAALYGTAAVALACWVSIRTYQSHVFGNENRAAAASSSALSGALDSGPRVTLNALMRSKVAQLHLCQNETNDT